MIARAAFNLMTTPSLAIDLDAAQRNIGVAVDLLRRGAAKLRPHFKAHKTTSLMRLQIEAGGCCGITCATAHEALVLAEAGFNEILVANQVADKAGLVALAQAAKLKRITVAVDCFKHVEMLEETARAYHVRFGVLIEVDVGMGRCGLNFGSSRLLPLAAEVRASSRLDFLGLQGYEGHAVVREDRAVRNALAWQSAEALRHEKNRIELGGIPCPVISGGGTGTLDFANAHGVLTEIQAGSYVLMDAVYSDVGVGFENALYCCTTLISRREPEAAVLNAGLKSMSGECGPPRSADGDFTVLGLSDEHTRIRPRSDWGAKIGDPVLLIPAHVDPTMNLHEFVFACSGNGTVQKWRVDGRRAASPGLL